MKYFLSHAWSVDNLGRNTHQRAIELSNALRRRGVATWIDDDCMGEDVDASMASGVDSSSTVLILLTHTYMEKVNLGAQSGCVQNCHKEFIYAHAMSKRCVPVVFEPSLLAMDKWPSGVVKLYLASTLFIDGSGDDMELVAERILQRERAKRSTIRLYL